MATRTFIFYADPGHGWLAVPMSLVRELGILTDITPYSYVSRDEKTAFLEEDCDYSTFKRAAEAAGIEFKLDERHSNSDSFVRNLPRWVWTKRPRISEPTLTLTGSDRTADHADQQHLF